MNENRKAAFAVLKEIAEHKGLTSYERMQAAALLLQHTSSNTDWAPTSAPVSV